ncbi:hypothetical protein C8J25_103356 [Sphingomonas faeni]|uniref:AbiTii domain-containing protein n=1 Tax=Sphingomonas faeni TaxID=185950 RepID=A0A2T5U7Z3_9SPHN|nr:hypothetical protein C8J25_103356 [Sphingomonas faeni]
MSLVEEIQAGALDRTVPVVDLLRRVKLAAAKLKLSDTLEWVERELNGFTCDYDGAPRYRIASGQLMGYSPYRGTYLAHGDPYMIAVLSTSFFREPIGSLESLINAEGVTIVMPIDLKLAKGLAKNGAGEVYKVHFSKNVLVGVVDTVRNLVLDWAIDLEAEGILGEGVSFSVEEKKKAADVAPNVHITNYGNFHQGDQNGHQNRTMIGGVDASSNSLEIDVFEQLQSAVTNNIDNATDREALLELIKQMNASKNTSAFKQSYTAFLTNAASYMTIVAPFLPALSAYLPA